jgi:hypothetical protein
VVSESQVAEYLRGLDDRSARVKYASSKALRLAARDAPELVYPHFERFRALLAGDNTILRWNAAWTLGYLAKADRAGRIDGLIVQFCAPIRGPEMIGAANAIGAAVEIALAKPHLADPICRAILGVQRARYATPECRNVAIGHAIQALERIYPLVQRPRALCTFVHNQLQNPRPATRRKAERFLKKRRNELVRAAAGCEL